MSNTPNRAARRKRLRYDPALSMGAQDIDFHAAWRWDRSHNSVSLRASWVLALRYEMRSTRRRARALDKAAKIIHRRFAPQHSPARILAWIRNDDITALHEECGIPKRHFLLPIRLGDVPRDIIAWLRWQGVNL